MQAPGLRGSSRVALNLPSHLWQLDKGDWGQVLGALLATVQHVAPALDSSLLQPWVAGWLVGWLGCARVGGWLARR